MPTYAYATKEGVRLPSVTTIISLLDRPALIGWAGKLCIAAGWEAGKKSLPPPYWRNVCYSQRDNAAESGTQAHALFERALLGETVVRAEETDQAWRAFQNAQEWREGLSIKFEVWPHEKPLVSVLGFGGTPDAIAKQGGSYALADWKTGGIYPEQLIQLAAYRHLLKEVEGIEISGAHLVRFHREHGDFHHHHFADDALDIGWNCFEALLLLWPRLRELKQRAK